MDIRIFVESRKHTHTYTLAEAHLHTHMHRHRPQTIAILDFVNSKLYYIRCRISMQGFSTQPQIAPVESICAFACMCLQSMQWIVDSMHTNLSTKCSWFFWLKSRRNTIMSVCVCVRSFWLLRRHCFLSKWN